jgi:hypothetical protein
VIPRNRLPALSGISERRRRSFLMTTEEGSGTMSYEYYATHDYDDN